MSYNKKVKHNRKDFVMQHDIHSERDAGADSEDRGRKLRRISRVAEWLALAGMVGVLAYSGYLWSNQAAL